MLPVMTEEAAAITRSPYPAHAVLLAIRRRITKLATAVGVRVSWRRDAEKSYAWDGNSIAGGNRFFSDVVHDIAHWQCCTPDRRSIVEFGLGPANETGRFNLAERRKIKDGHDKDKEEPCSSLLGILWEKRLRLGCNWRNTWDIHGWSESGRDEEGVYSILCLLAQRGLINAKLQPQYIPLETPVVIPEVSANRLMRLGNISRVCR